MKQRKPWVHHLLIPVILIVSAATAQPVPVIVGDLDSSGAVNSADLLHLLQNWHLPDPTPTPSLSPQEAYEAAVADAAIAEVSEICGNLVALTPENSELIWRGKGVDRQILMVTFTSWPGYADSIGQEMWLTREVWVTAAPQIQDFIRKHPAGEEGLTFRIRQLLGLPPTGTHQFLVEMWVNPDEMFRPSPDPEVTDTVAELDFPRSTRFLQVSPAHQDWIRNLSAVSYGPGGYPWTRLGYTYDWGNPKTEVGLSEFVIPASTTVEIHSASTVEAYFSKPKPFGSGN